MNGVVPALLTNHKGAARPSYVQPGMMWIDDGGANWLLKVFDGAADATIAAIDPATHAVVDVFLKLDGSQVLSALQKAAVQLVLDVPSSAAVEAMASKENRSHNGARQICQDGAVGATVAMSSTGYIMDGVKAVVIGSGQLTCSQVLKTTPRGSPYRTRAVVSTADASLAATDLYGLSSPIEGTDVCDLMFGTVPAKPFVHRWMTNRPAGTYCRSFANAGETRSYTAGLYNRT